MYPVLGKIGPLTIHTYGVLVAVGIFISIALAAWRSRQIGPLAPDKATDLLFVVVVTGFLGARIFYILQQWDYYRQNWLEAFALWEGGLVFYGGLISSLVGVFFYARAVGLRYLEALDFAIPYVVLAHVFGRIGCFFAGCCFGKGGHPVQLYEAAFNLGLFGFLFRTYPRRRFTGQGILLYLILYPLGRFFLEFLRGDQGAVVWVFTLPQVLSVVFISLGVTLYGISSARH